MRDGVAMRQRAEEADGVEKIERGAERERAHVEFGADAYIGQANQRRAYLDALDAERLDLGDHRLVEQRARRDDDVIGLGIEDVFGGGAAEDTLAERRDRAAALDDRLHLERALGELGRASCRERVCQYV